MTETQNNAAPVKAVLFGLDLGEYDMEKSMEELAARLRGRGTEDEAAVQKRLARAEEELREKDAYDFAIVNDDARRCADELYEILRARQSE